MLAPVNGNSTSRAYYTYDGGKDSTGEYIRLHSEYDSKVLTYPDSYYNKPVLSKIKYRNPTVNFEYETTRKKLGEDGFYESLRVVKRYEQEAKYQNNSIIYTGEINPVTYSYSGTYNENTYSDETGYPNYEFTDETTLNEQWKSTAISGNLKTENVFSNNALITNKVTDLSDNTEITTSYTYHTTFKNEPTEIIKTVSDNDGSLVTYSKSSYNSWGGLASNSLEVTADIYNNTDLLDKYTTYYEYDDGIYQAEAVAKYAYYPEDQSSYICSRNWNLYDNNGNLHMKAEVDYSQTIDSLHPTYFTGY